MDRKLIWDASALSFGVYADLAFKSAEAATKGSAESVKRYVVVADAAAVSIGLFASWLDKSFWPLAGTLGVGIVMHSIVRYVTTDSPVTTTSTESEWQ